MVLRDLPWEKSVPYVENQYFKLAAQTMRDRHKVQVVEQL